MKIRQFFALAASSLLSLSASAAIINIDFDDPANIGKAYCQYPGFPSLCPHGVNPFNENDLIMGHNGAWGTLTIVAPPATYTGPQNGTPYAQVGFGTAPVTVSSTATFDFLGFDLAEYSATTNYGTISVVGTKEDGSFMTNFHTIDGIIGDPVIEDFQSFDYSGWTDLVSIAFGQSYNAFSLDNILLEVADVQGQNGSSGANTVTSPGFIPLLAIGLIALFGSRRQQSRA